ncbi:MAG: uncharacterized protein KVP18_003211 [Porospora cf. gigantea A]|uniref:uncharacterized protein n=2 Tax=Porospora cf. gigantea A TaxID=2853593 RepID=UPI00355A8211|nr:MAG: hypothetical protein KVP18_003211 [Porospora cf. gigantea A]
MKRLNALILIVTSSAGFPGWYSSSDGVCRLLKRSPQLASLEYPDAVVVPESVGLCLDSAPAAAGVPPDISIQCTKLAMSSAVNICERERRVATPSCVLENWHHAEGVPCTFVCVRQGSDEWVDCLQGHVQPIYDSSTSTSKTTYESTTKPRKPSKTVPVVLSSGAAAAGVAGAFTIYYGAGDQTSRANMAGNSPNANAAAGNAMDYGDLENIGAKFETSPEEEEDDVKIARGFSQELGHEMSQELQDEVAEMGMSKTEHKIMGAIELLLDD